MWNGWSMCCAWFTRLLWASSCGVLYSVVLPYERDISQVRIASNQPLQAKLQPNKAHERSWRCFNSWHNIFTNAMVLHHLSSSSWHPQALWRPWSCCNWRSCPLFPEARPCQSTTLVLNLKPELSPTCISSCWFNFDIWKISRFLSLRHPVFFSSFCICVFCSVFPGFILTGLDCSSHSDRLEDGGGVQDESEGEHRGGPPPSSC